MPQVTVQQYPHPQFPVAAGYPMRAAAVAQDDFSQAGARYRFYDAQRQARRLALHAVCIMSLKYMHPRCSCMASHHQHPLPISSIASVPAVLHGDSTHAQHILWYSSSLWAQKALMSEAGMLPSSCVQLRLAQRISDLLTSPMVNEAIQVRWMVYLVQIDPQLATQVHEVSLNPRKNDLCTASEGTARSRGDHSRMGTRACRRQLAC